MAGTGKPLITGHLGKTSKEAVMVGLAWADHNLGAISRWVDDKTGEEERVLAPDRDVSIHFSNKGTLTKSGYSLGAVAATAVVACFLEESYDLVIKEGCTAISGEINLRGHLLAVTDIPTKIRTAKRLGCARLIIPESNKSDVESMAMGLADDSKA